MPPRWAKMPTTVHSFLPTLNLFPKFNPANSDAAARPTMISFLPVSNRRPSTISTSSRTSKASSSTPRSGTLASVPVERFGRLITTNNSADTSGPDFPCTTPGASPTIRDSSRLMPLIISESAPLRRMTALRGEPATTIALRNPLAMESTPTKTATTPAIPNTAANDEPLRCMSVAKERRVTSRAWRMNLSMVRNPVTVPVSWRDVGRRRFSGGWPGSPASDR